MQRAADEFNLKYIDVEVAEGIVVLSGFAPTEADKSEAERIAWSAPNINKVGNEIMLGGRQTRLQNTKDGFLNTSLRTRLVSDKSVRARNINIEVHDGIVYLLGVARSQQELERIAHIASTTKGAREVISYITLKQVGQSATSQTEYTNTPTHQTHEDYGLPPSALSGDHLAGDHVSGQATLGHQQALPDFLSQTPEGATNLSQPIDPTAPYYRDAITGERLDLDPKTGTIPFRPPAETAQTALPQNSPNGSITRQLAAPPTEFPSDEELGRYRTGTPGEAVSIIESAPYYIDPDTGEQIPVKFIRQVPR